MTLGQLVDFFLSRWRLDEVLDMNELDEEESQDFVHPSSAFYPVSLQSFGKKSTRGALWRKKPKTNCRHMQQATRVAPIVLHIPHASTYIPEDIRPALLLDDDALADELLRLTDHFTDELFGGLVAGAAEIAFPVSRLVVDPERFEEDQREPAARHGMGVIYTRGSQGQVLRAPPTPEERRTLLERFYHPHHRRLATAVQERLAACGPCLVLDCHSFPRMPLPTDRSDAAQTSALAPIRCIRHHGCGMLRYQPSKAKGSRCLSISRLPALSCQRRGMATMKG